jgi:hypothetical protein
VVGCDVGCSLGVGDEGVGGLLPEAEAIKWSMSQLDLVRFPSCPTDDHPVDSGFFLYQSAMQPILILIWRGKIAARLHATSKRRRRVVFSGLYIRPRKTTKNITKAC